MRFRNFLVVNLRKPVIGRNSPGIAQNQSAYGISNRRILFYTPVFDLDITVDYVFVIQNGRLHGTHFFTLLTIQDISLGCLRITGLLQNLLHTVLNILHVNLPVFHLILKIGRDTQSQQINNIVVILHLCGVKRFHNHFVNLSQHKVCRLSVSFDNLKHV